MYFFLLDINYFGTVFKITYTRTFVKIEVAVSI